MCFPGLVPYRVLKGALWPHCRRQQFHTRPDLPSIGVSGDIRVRPEQREAFLDGLQQTLQDLFTRYGGAEGDAFRLAVACYPKGDPDDRA